MRSLIYHIELNRLMIVKWRLVDTGMQCFCELRYCFQRSTIFFNGIHNCSISLQHRPYRTVTPSATTNRKRAAAACAPSNQTAPQPERNSLRNSSGPTAVFYVPAIQPMPTRSGRMAATVASASIHQYYADFEAGYQIPFHELEEDEVLPIVKLHWTELEDSMAITNFRKAGTSGNNFPGAKICI